MNLWLIEIVGGYVLVNNSKYMKWSWVISIIGIASVVLIFPQLISKSMVISSDSLFHFNRFYDVSQQIEKNNFQYFISMYGFQQSGRIVNALYGPIIAYFHGTIVFISSSWHMYQVVSNFMLYFFAGISMFIFLVQCDISRKRALYFSIFYLTTYAIQYWIIRQGFTSWGAAFFPLCLIPLVTLVKSYELPPIKTAMCVAGLFQIHVFSAILLVICYLIAFSFVIFQQKKKRRQLYKNCFIAIFIFFLLTLNIWYTIFYLYRSNQILSPFVNKTMYLNTINSNSYYWLLNPAALCVGLFYALYYLCKNNRKLVFFDKIVGIMLCFFLILSTNLFPWKSLVDNDWTIVNLIQFPFRFFVPASIFLICFIGRREFSNKFNGTKLGQFILVLSIGQALVLSTLECFKWQKESLPIQTGKHTFVFSEDNETIKESFFINDKSQALKLIQKSTPDYLPIYEKSLENTYELYAKNIIELNQGYEKEVNNNKLNVMWNGSGEKRKVPLVVYEATEIIFNGKLLSKEEIETTEIGTLFLEEYSGENMLEVSFRNPPLFNTLLFFRLLFWSYLIFAFLRRKVATTMNNG